jgi:hypothetical protein
MTEDEAALRRREQTRADREREAAPAGKALAAAATRAWGRPSNKQGWTELQAALAQLKGRP